MSDPNQKKNDMTDALAKRIIELFIGNITEEDTLKAYRHIVAGGGDTRLNEFDEEIAREVHQKIISENKPTSIPYLCSTILAFNKAFGIGISKNN